MEHGCWELALLQTSVASIQCLGSDSMKRAEKLELVREALHQILEERMRKGKDDHDEDDGGALLSKLLIQLDFLEEDARPREAAAGEDVSESPKQDDQLCGRKAVDIGEVAKEIRRVKMQNVITHCLLSVMIVLTAAWQFSEVSLLMAKQKLSDPLRTIGDLIKGYFKGKGAKPKIKGYFNKAAAALPPIPLPALPHVGLPPLTLDEE